MTAQQRDMVDQILRNAPFDLGGDVTAQRPLLDQMLTAQPLPADVRVTPADLGGVPVAFIDIAGVEPRGIAAKAAADDVAVILDITPGVPHVFQAFAALLEEGDAALNRAARFVNDNTTQQAAA